MFKLILTGFITLSLTACANLSQLTSDAIDTAYIIKVNDNIANTVMKANLSPSEKTLITNSEKSMKELESYLKDISPSSLVMLDSVIDFAVDDYKLAKLVTLNHKDEYSLSDWEGLVALDNQLSMMYERYQDFKDQQMYQEAASQLGEYARLGVKVALLIGA